MVLLLAAASLPASALFSLREIVVEGTERLSPDAVRTASGLEPGLRSIFTVNAREVADRLLQHPWIAAATVRARPPHTILIRIRERIPVAATPAPPGFALLDGAGRVLEVLGVRPPLVLVSERGRPLPWVAAGEEVPSAAVRVALDILSQMPGSLRPVVAHLQVTATREVFLYTVDGLEVRAGPVRGLRQRLADAPEVLQVVRAQGIPLEYIDMSLPDQVILKPRAGP